MSHAIDVNAVSKSYPIGSRLPFRGPRRVLDALVDVSLQVSQGEIFGLVGRNGYGKTTLIKCICSLLEPTRGSVRVLGHDTVHATRALRRELGYVSADERSFYWRLTGNQNLAFFARLQGLDPSTARRRIGELAERFEASALLPRRFHEYSTGNRQRLSLVRALLHAPKVLVLDEPTRSLDPFAAANLRRALSAWVREDARRSVLVTSHNLAEVEELSHRVGVMTRGRLAECGTMAELRARFDDRERIRLWVEPPPDAAALRAGLTDLEPLELCAERDPVRGDYVEFLRRADDAKLDRVLRKVAELGGRVRSFERTALSLQDIIDHVDARDGGAP
jgi:ABC-2 type transport system ATP-binding protein